MGDGASGAIQVSRCAWGRKGRLQLQIFGARGAIVFDQERFNEVAVYLAEGPAEDQGFRTVLMVPPILLTTASSWPLAIRWASTTSRSSRRMSFSTASRASRR
jgi:hypothetical protein